MARFLGLSILLALVLYGIWPYASILRLNNALENPDTEALAPLIDLAAIQAQYKARIGSSVDGLLSRVTDRQTEAAQSGPPASRQPANHSNGEQNLLQLDTDKVLGWLANNFKQLGDAALDQAINLDWARSTLVAASQRADDPAGPNSSNFISAVDFAFFESWDRFVIRLGKLGAAPTFVTLSLQGHQWLITDITH
ncbi:MAG: DUF2939 domain-containing protein [Lamprobacter sp.]|uniref:DUF2939 domain-containing protein n=1 Tax=Lamprobacter sp. TaxID=3100796 RepID=UPI002B256D0F|nr:DUF2939 domain-containing protein [Lamprobacter sp.]MEA3640919.1 DUF2939 domain-containing protein [Lamprobacter sp.]